MPDITQLLSFKAYLAPILDIKLKGLLTKLAQITPIFDNIDLKIFSAYCHQTELKSLIL